MTDTPHVTEPARFPAWARIALGFLVAFVTFLINGDSFHIEPDARALISSLIMIVATAGIVPPTPDTIKISPTVSLLLTVAVVVGNYVLVAVVDLDLLLQGILTALLALAASIGITPPQARPVTR